MGEPCRRGGVEGGGERWAVASAKSGEPIFMKKHLDGLKRIFHFSAHASTCLSAFCKS